MKANGLIIFLTDFGLSDGFVGTMKGVIHGINPSSKIIDLTHNIPPQDIDSAAFVLKTSYRYFPQGTLFVVIVDPGVGSERRIIAVKSHSYFFLAPDNGVLKYIFYELPDCKVYHVTNQKYFLSEISQTFHGRDIFSPVAAHIASGLELNELGEEITDFHRGEVLVPAVEKDKIIGHIIYIDRFGNLITNIPHEIFKKRERISISVGTQTIKNLSNSYSEVKSGEVLALIGSSGYLEISIRNGNASRKLGLRRYEKVEVKF